MNKTVKIISILLIAVMLIMSSSTAVMAKTATEIISEMDTKKELSDTANITTVGGKITGIITTVGIVISVIVLLILGIKYMMGSASEKAEYKKTMIPYLVGAVLIFGASAIAKVVVQLAGTITTT